MRNLILLCLLFFSLNVSYSQSFQKLIGNANNNRVGKMILHDNHYYILGQNGTKATITKMGLAGNFIWTNQTNEDGFWNDVIVNKDGNLMTVGYQGALSIQENWNSNIGVVNSNNGNFISIKTYNFGFRDLFSKIFENPLPSNPSFPYYVIGLQINDASDSDKVSVNMMNGMGTINTRRLISGPEDLQVHNGFWVNNATGDFALCGNKYDNTVFEGAVVNFDRHSTNAFMTEMNNPVLISNILPSGANFIYSGQTTNTPQKGLIWKRVGNTNYSYTIDGLNTILNIFSDPTGTILYVLGVESVAPNRRILLTLDNTQNTIPITSARVFTNGETSFTDGFANLASNQKILFTDTRTGNPNSLGQQDGLVMDMDLSLQSCLTDTITGFVLSSYEVTTSLGSVTNVANTPTVPQIFNGTTISYQMGEPCEVPCNISLEVNKSVDICSNATLTGAASGGTGPYSYQWDLSCNGVDGSSNPYTVQIGAGTTPFCVTVTDELGCTAILNNELIIGVSDLIKPVITCPNNIILNNNPSRCFANYAPIIIVTDNCDPEPACDCTMTGATNGNLPKNTLVQFNVGVTTVTCNATDASGNVSLQCTYTVTVFDTEQPTIVCPPNITISCDENENDYMITGQATATDNCPGVIKSHSDSYSGNACTGTITRTWTATDNSGAIIPCTQLIKIEDKVAPAISCPAFITINCDQQPLPSLTGMPQSVDNCQSGITPTYTDNVIGTGCNQYIQRIWSVSDGCGNSNTCVQEIHFDDLVPPTISCPPNITISCEIMPDTIITGSATASDNCNNNFSILYIDMVEGDNCNKIINRIWRVSNGCENFAFCTQIITQKDTSSPMITCPPNLTLSCNENTTTSSTGVAEATDNCTSNISIRHTDAYTAQGCTQDLIRTWTATDVCGNVDTCVQTITLVNDIKPNVVCPPDLTLSCGANTSSAFTGEPTLSDFCQSNLIVTYVDISSGQPCDVTISRTWTVNDGCGNVDTCVQTIKLEDKTPPTFICPPSNVNPIECTTNPNLGVPTNILDNCGGKIDQSKVDVFSTDGCITTVTRTWTVTDQCGNSDTCVQIILMQDTKPPTIANCGIKYTVQGIRNPDGICYGNATILTPDVSDLCSENVIITNSFNNTSDASASTYPTGQTIITWTAKDDCGLMTMCPDTVLVLDCDIILDCKCPDNPTFTLKEGNKNPITVSCNQSPSTIPSLDCPADPISISGNFGCISSNPNVPCPSNIVNWTLDRPTLSDLTGSAIGTTFGITFNANDISIGGNYSLNMTTICGSDTCRCSIKWIQRECEPDCKCPNNPTFTLKEGNKNPINVSCNQSPSTIPSLDCPADPISISGNFGCISSNPNVPCSSNIVNWILDRPTLSDLTGSAIGATFGVTFNATDISIAGNYTLNMTTICGSDTCRCSIKWIQRECEPDCKCPNNPTFTLKEGNKNPITVSCNQSPNTIPMLDCPVEPLSISGAYGCQSSNPNVPCPPSEIKWTLERPVGVDLTGVTTGPNLGINFTAASISDAGTYSLTLVTTCNGELCRCIVKWVQKACADSCCTLFSSTPVNNPFGLTGGKSILGMDFIDVNGDSYMDHIYSNSSQLLYRLNPGNGSNFGSELVLTSNVRQPYNCDYDNDGKEDIFGIRLTPSLPSLGFIKNLGGGSFGPFNSIITLSNVRFAVGDISQDGIIDLITVNAAANSQILYYEGISGTNPSFKAGVPWFTTDISNTFNAEFPIPELYDIDCDGDLDLFLGLSGEIRSFTNNGGVIAPNILPNFNTVAFFTQTYNQPGGSEFITPRYVSVDTDFFTEFFIDYNNAQQLLYFDCATSDVDETVLAVRQFKVFPNPTNNKITIQYDGDDRIKANIDILNLWGQNVMTLNDVILDQDYSIDMSHLSSGMYLLRIASKQNQHIFLKIIKSE